MQHANDYKQGIHPVVREMELGDLPMVVFIEEVCRDLDGWSEKLFADCMSIGYPSFVLKYEDMVCGFIVCSIGADEMQILNLKVDPTFRRKGFAYSLLSTCIDLAKARNCFKVILEVRLSNVPAQRLYEKFSFIQDGCRKDYYSAENAAREDALLYTLSLAPEPN